MRECWAGTLTLVLLGTASIAAQTGQAPPAGVRGGAAAEADSAEVVRSLRATSELIGMLDTYAIVQAQRTLQLDDDQYGLFIPRLKKLQETRRRNQRVRNRMIAELRRLAGPRAASPVDDNVLRERLEALRDHDRRAAAELLAAYAALDEILDPRQQARFRVFEEQIENRKLDLLLRARARAGQLGTPR
jgi:hypothetical protein